MGKVSLILGIIGVLIGGAIFLISLMLPAITNNKINFREATPGIGLGLILLFISLVVPIIGLVLVLTKKKPNS